MPIVSLESATNLAVFCLGLHVTFRVLQDMGFFATIVASEEAGKKNSVPRNAWRQYVVLVAIAAVAAVGGRMLTSQWANGDLQTGWETREFMGMSLEAPFRFDLVPEFSSDRMNQQLADAGQPKVFTSGRMWTGTGDSLPQVFVTHANVTTPVGELDMDQAARNGLANGMAGFPDAAAAREVYSQVKMGKKHLAGTLWRHASYTYTSPSQGEYHAQSLSCARSLSVERSSWWDAGGGAEYWTIMTVGHPQQSRAIRKLVDSIRLT
eukprot:TRINITY_DN6572_c0_g2_i1.p1 TRINITY_DN6572_c0_g2~~TRINITY_DN6572_c0_g2_i1.p1  ORF type:complete len:265 (-),score=54.93 TRINITY_DN6572_c0_g2_i1:365-1159(-)